MEIIRKPSINCKGGLSLRWIDNCVLTTATIGPDADATGADSSAFKITDAKLYVSIVTLSTEDSAKLAKPLSEGFIRRVYWKKYNKHQYNKQQNKTTQFIELLK